MWNDEIWDEDRWEAFLRENDRRIDRYVDLIFGFIAAQPRPAIDDQEALSAWKAELRAFLEENGWRKEESLLPLLWLDDSEETTDTEEPSAFDEEVLSDELFEDDFDDVQMLPVYRSAFHLTTDVLDWTDTLAPEVKDSTLVHFCSHIHQIPANVAKGHGIGYERDTIGGNIACVKRALKAANNALRLLHELKHESHVDAPVYRQLYEQTYEVRNELGIYVQELRDRFNLGID